MPVGSMAGGSECDRVVLIASAATALGTVNRLLLQKAAICECAFLSY